MKKTIFSAVAILFGISAFAQNTDKLVENYLAVKDALVKGDSKTASAAISTYHKSIKAESSFPQKEALLKATEIMEKANGLEKQRAGFNEISTITWKVVQDSKTSKPLYYHYCPMKKTYWVSNEKEIRNPYYGSQMLTCGKVVESKN